MTRHAAPTLLALLVVTGCAGGSSPVQAQHRTPAPASALPSAAPVTASASASDTADPCATPNRVVTRRPPPGGALTPADRAGGSGAFAGTWRVHGVQMTIRADATGTLVATEGTFAETDALRFARYRHPERLLATFVKVTYANRNTGRPIPRPTDACSLADGFNEPGDQFVLRFAAPHLLIDSVVVSHVAPVNLTVNPYWCGTGVSASDEAKCGA